MHLNLNGLVTLWQIDNKNIIPSLKLRTNFVIKKKKPHYKFLDTQESHGPILNIHFCIHSMLVPPLLM